MISAKGAQKKGKRFEKYLLDKIRQEVDANSYHPKGSGNGTEKGDIVVPRANNSIEAKNQKAIALMDWWEQAKEQVFNEQPVLMIRNPRKAEFQETLAVVSLEYLIELLNGDGGTMEIEPKLDYPQRSALASLKRSASEVLKLFPYE